MKLFIYIDDFICKVSKELLMEQQKERLSKNNLSFAVWFCKFFHF